MTISVRPKKPGVCMAAIDGTGQAFESNSHMRWIWELFKLLVGEKKAHYVQGPAGALSKDISKIKKTRKAITAAFGTGQLNPPSPLPPFRELQWCYYWRRRCFRLLLQFRY